MVRLGSLWEFAGINFFFKDIGVIWKKKNLNPSHHSRKLPLEWTVYTKVSVNEPRIFGSYRCNNYVDRKVCFSVNAWAWRHRHSRTNCLITRRSTWDLDNSLLFMLLLCVVIELETWCCWSTTIENSKQKTTKHRWCFFVGWKLWHQAREFE